MKKVLKNSIMKKVVLLVWLFLIPKTAIAWTLDPGNPLYATAKANGSDGPIYVAVGDAVNFTASAPESDMDTREDPEGNTYYYYDNVTVSWNFGDGGSSSERDVSHTYNTPAKYTVILTVDDSPGEGYYNDPSAQDSIEVYVVGVETEGPHFLPLFKANTPQITLTATIEPFAAKGGTYLWEIKNGSDKISIVGNSTTESVVIKGKKESENNNDVDVKLIYTIGTARLEAHHLLTVQRPTKLTREGLEFFREEVEVGGVVIVTYIGCKRFNGTLYDKLGNSIAGVPGTERIVIRYKNSTPKRFLPFARTGTTITDKDGKYGDIYVVPIVGNAPSNTHIEVHQTLIFGGYEGDNEIVIEYTSVSDSYPIQLQ